MAMIREQNFSASSGGPFSCWLNSFSNRVRPANTSWRPPARRCGRCAEPPAPGARPSSAVQSADRLRPARGFLAGTAAAAVTGLVPRSKEDSGRLWTLGLWLGDGDGEGPGELSCRVVVLT